MASFHNPVRVSRSLCRTIARAVTGLLLAFAIVGTAPGIASSFASPPADTVRNLPLPKRWNARHLDNPVFNSRVYVVEAGRPHGPPVLLVHGLGQNGYQDWWEVMHALETEYRLITLDLPGFARSEVPSGELSPARYARFLNWLMHQLDLRQVNLVGHSMGAAVALYLAGEYPARISNVILADAAGVLQRVAFLREVSQERMEDYRFPALLADYKKQLLNWGGQLAERVMIQSDLDASRILRTSDQNWNTLLSDQPNINAAVSLLDTDFSRVLAHFDKPTTIIWGQDDSVTPLRTGHLLHGRIPASRLHVIDGAGHVPMKTHTRAFIARLHRALKRPPGTNESGSLYKPSQGNLVCNNQTDGTASGVFDRIIIDRCPGMQLVNARARLVVISESPGVQLRNVTVDGETVALDIKTSSVTATNFKASGNPAVRVDNSRLDIASGLLNSPGAALRVARRSTVILSVSRLDSGVRKGTLHGAVIATDMVLDDSPRLRPH